MAVLTLPTSPGLASLSPRLVTTRGELRGATGASLQRVGRTGSRWAIDGELPAMGHAAALAWVDLFAEVDTCVLEVPEPGVTMGTPGTPLVNGAGQTGSSLFTDGWIPGYTIVKGKWFSVSCTVGGVASLYFYQVRSAVTANGAGQATLAIRPMLRASPADNAALNFNPAKIEGFITLGDGAMKITADRLMKGCSFSIEEWR